LLYTPEVTMTRMFGLVAAAMAMGVLATDPASAQTWWMAPTPVNAGEGVMILATPAGPYSAIVPLVTTARTVAVGPLVRVSGCVWARERVPGKWVRFRVCAPPPLAW
jgi:hypothetical protein